MRHDMRVKDAAKKGGRKSGGYFLPRKVRGGDFVLCTKSEDIFKGRNIRSDNWGCPRGGQLDRMFYVLEGVPLVIYSYYTMCKSLLQDI